MRPVETQLSPDKAVTAVAGAAETATGEVRVGISDQAAAQARRMQQMQSVITKHLDINPATRDVVVKSVRQDTGETVQQYPDEVVLRLREFAARMREQAADEALARRVSDGDKVNSVA